MKFDSPRRSQISHYNKLKVKQIYFKDGKPWMKCSRANNSESKDIPYVGNKGINELQERFKEGKSYTFATDKHLTVWTTQWEYKHNWRKN